MLDQVKLITTDPLGFFMKEKTFSLKEKVYIEAELQRLDWLPLGNNTNIKVAQISQPIGFSGVGQEMYGIREFRYNDSIRFIDWKSSARQRQLMIRQFEENTAYQVCVFLDINQASVNQQSRFNNLEYLVTMTSSILHYLSGINCRVLFSSGSSEQFSEGPSQVVYTEARERLMNLKAEDIDISEQIENAFDRIQRNSIFFCFSMHEPASLQRQFSALFRRDVDIRWYHASKNLFEDQLNESKVDAIYRLLERREKFCKPIIVKPQMDVSELLMQ